MPEFFHALAQAKEYFELIADERDILPAVVEQEFSVMDDMITPAEAPANSSLNTP